MLVMAIQTEFEVKVKSFYFELEVSKSRNYSIGGKLSLCPILFCFCHSYNNPKTTTYLCNNKSSTTVPRVNIVHRSLVNQLCHGFSSVSIMDKIIYTDFGVAMVSL